MKLLAPASRPDEVEMLVKSGADELYCGVIPQQWSERYSLVVPLNRRDTGPGNLATLTELRELVDLAHRLGARVHLTLNAPTYTDGQLEFVCGLAAECAEEIGVDAFIVADVGLLGTLIKRRPELRLHVSSLAAVHNVHAARFFHELGASRVILPRQTRVEEAVAMARALPDLEFEVFILNDGCIYEEGHCSTVHGVGPMCLTEWSAVFRPVESGGPLPAAELEALQSNLRDYRRWIDCHVAPGEALTPTGMPAGPCGLCAIPDLHHGGVHSLKVIGREAPPFKKLRSVQQVRRVLDRVAAGWPAAECRGLAQALRGTPALCRSGYACYYPEIIRGA